MAFFAVAATAPWAGSCVCDSLDSTVLSGPGTFYAVLEIKPLGGRVLNGPEKKVYKVALIGGLGKRQMFYFDEWGFTNCSPYPADCVDRARKRKALMIENPGRIPMPYEQFNGWTVGMVKTFADNSLGFQSLGFGTQSVLIVPEKPGGQVHSEVKMLKRCQARLTRVAGTVSSPDTRGMITLPGKKEVAWAELTGECIEDADLQL
jgi:hypothetical protein